MTLTEQWKKGELPVGWYYVKKVNGQEDIAECYKVTDVISNVSHTLFEFSEDIEQVLAKVPSYEETLEANKQLEHKNLLLKVANAELREQLEILRNGK